VADSIKAFGYIGIKNIFVLFVDAGKDSLDRIMA